MGLLGDITAYIDNLKRRGSNTLADLATNPLGLLSRNLSAFSESLPAAPDSVMPSGSGLLNRPGFQQWGMDVALNAPTMGLLGHTVYHGSPHKFDKFDASKIGTGEGAQAYGHGLYLAESPGVAKYYQVAEENAFPIIRKGDSRLDLALRESTDEADNKIYSTIAAITPRGAQFGDGMLDAIKRRLQHDADYFAGSPAGRAADAALAKFDALRPSLKGAKLEYDRGSLYTVDLPDEWLPKMLDWDKPLSQQSEAVRAAVTPLLRDAVDIAPYRGGWGDLEPNHDALRELFTKRGTHLGLYSSSDATALNLPGSAVIKALGKGDKESWRASEELRKAGIPGIRYLDGGSRKSGEGTYNYVVFPGMEGLLKILSRE